MRFDQILWWELIDEEGTHLKPEWKEELAQYWLALNEMEPVKVIVYDIVEDKTSFVIAQLYEANTVETRELRKVIRAGYNRYRTASTQKLKFGFAKVLCEHFAVAIALLGPMRKRSLSPESEVSDVSLTSRPKKKRKPSPPEQPQLIPGTDERFLEDGDSIFRLSVKGIWPGGRFRCTLCQYAVDQHSAFFGKHRVMKSHLANVKTAELITKGKVVWQVDAGARKRKGGWGDGAIMIQLPKPATPEMSPTIAFESPIPSVVFRPVPSVIARGMVPGVPELPPVDLSLNEPIVFDDLPQPSEDESEGEGEVMSIEQAAAVATQDDPQDPPVPDPEPEPVGTTNKWLGPLLTGLLLLFLAWGLGAEKEHTYSRP
jgi:hypothetical protein